MSDHFQAIVTVLSLINPAICVSIFGNIGHQRTKGQKVSDATQATLAIAIILLIAALLGTSILNAFGISLDAFAVAGGGVLVWMGFSMLSGGTKDSASSSASPQKEESLSPLILFAASPGTITGVITISANHGSHGIPISAVVAVLLSTLLLWIALLLYAYFGKESKGGLVRDTVTRFMGLIVVAMGVQFLLSGVAGFFG